MRARGPHLLTIDDEMVAMVDGAGSEARQIAAGVGLGKALAPQLVGIEDARQMALLLFLCPPMNQARAEQIEAACPRQHRRAGVRVLLVEDDLLHKVGAAATIFLWPGEPDPPRGVHHLLPLDALRSEEHTSELQSQF